MNARLPRRIVAIAATDPEFTAYVWQCEHVDCEQNLFAPEDWSAVHAAMRRLPDNAVVRSFMGRVAVYDVGTETRRLQYGVPIQGWAAPGTFLQADI